jgi:hypothetical protein
MAKETYSHWHILGTVQAFSQLHDLMPGLMTTLQQSLKCLQSAQVS